MPNALDSGKMQNHGEILKSRARSSKNLFASHQAMVALAIFRLDQASAGLERDWLVRIF
jgi:hypothetical protein